MRRPRFESSTVSRPVNRRKFFAASVLALGLAGCRREEATGDGRPRVVASFFPIYDFTRRLAGEEFAVTCPVPPGADPHGMEATPGVAREIAGAQLVLLLGLGMDGWIAKLARSERRAKVVELATDLPTRPDLAGRLAEFADSAASTAHGHEHGHAHDADDQADGLDPHVWLDPMLAQELVRRIADALVALAPGQANVVRERRDALLAELGQLDEEFAVALQDLPERRLVTFHGAFAYLFARYNLEIAGVIQPFPGDEPSAAYLRKLVGVMRELGLRTIFAEPQLPDRPAQIIARELGGTVELLDPCETILADEPEATYLDRQRRNLATLRRVLGDQAQP